MLAVGKHHFCTAAAAAELKMVFYFEDKLLLLSVQKLATFQ